MCLNQILSAAHIALLLLKVQDGHGVDHAFSAGRVAFSCPTNAVNPIHDMVIEKGGTVLTAPLTLSTPGKAEVVVTILADPDGYEICFVEVRGSTAQTVLVSVD
jgi:hypothetical protein